MTRIAFLGLGNMGGPMAANLVGAGHLVTGYDPSPAAVDAARRHGLEVADHAADAVTSAEVVITMFPTGRHVLEAYAGASGSPGLLEAAAAGTLFVDCSTISVEDAQQAHRLAADVGHRAVDAPVSGGVIGAQNATLAFMVGADDDDFDSVAPILEAMGRRIVHCGGPGLGQAAKVCNNMILAVSQIAVAEAFILGERLGLSHQTLFDVASNASGQCWALTTNCPVPGPVPGSPANFDYRPGFASALMSKDLGLAGHALDATGVDARMGRLAAALYREFASGGGGDRDFSAIIESIRESSVVGS